MTAFLYLMGMSTNVREIMKTTLVWFTVTTVTNSKETLKFIVNKGGVWTNDNGYPPQLTVNI